MYPNHKSKLSRLTTALLLGGAFAGASAVTRADDAPSEPTREQLQQQIRELQERMRSLEKSSETRPSTAPAQTQAPTGESEAIGRVLDDASARSQPFYMASGGITAGYDKGFFIKSDDGNFLFKPSVQFQFRNETTWRQDAAHGGSDDDFQNGFEVRRARFRFDGNLFSPKFIYSFVWDTNRAGGAVSLLDAWGQYQFAEQFAFKFGQFKESVFHERDVSGYQQLAVDRSLNDALLGGNITDRVQGVSLIYGGTKTNPVRAEVAFHDGANSRNTNFQDGALHWGAGGRFEYKLFGDWSDYKDLTAKGGKQNLLVFGGGADYTERDGADVLLASADADFELADKFTVYGAVHGAYTDPHESVDQSSRFDWGALVQAGYLLDKHWELFGRYDIVQLDDDFVAAGKEDQLHEITAGVNYYFGHDGSYLHRAKFSLDVTYLPNGAPSDQTQSAILANSEDEIVVRAQLQFIL